MTHMTHAILDALRAEVNAVDAMLVHEEVNNDRERAERNTPDTARLARYAGRRGRLLDHRQKLQAIYIAITGEDPWKDIAF